MQGLQVHPEQPLPWSTTVPVATSQRQPALQHSMQAPCTTEKTNNKSGYMPIIAPPWADTTWLPRLWVFGDEEDWTGVNDGVIVRRYHNRLMFQQKFASPVFLCSAGHAKGDGKTRIHQTGLLSVTVCTHLNKGSVASNCPSPKKT
jgi:hypothetical protein